jgi:hypothetical protein
MTQPYSKRGKPLPTTFTTSIPYEIRARVYFTLRDIIHEDGGQFIVSLVYALRTARREYISHPELTTWAEHDQAQEYFQKCDDERFIDFLETIFRSGVSAGLQVGVEVVNRIFREEGVGFEFTAYSHRDTPTEDRRGTRREWTYPAAVLKADELVHTTTVMPALNLLSGTIWKGADVEMLKAHEHLRDGNCADAIHWAGKCLESVLQIICDKKPYPYVPDKSTLNPLLQACHTGGLFKFPYIDVIQKSSGELRNKYGGHGKAKSAAGDATPEIAEHMIQITSAHVLLLAKWAQLK